MTGDTGVATNLVLLFAIYLSIFMIHYFIEITSDPTNDLRRSLFIWDLITRMYIQQFQ